MSNTTIYNCEKCLYKTANKSNFNAHLESKKHARVKEHPELCHRCNNCNKPYLSYSGLWSHVKKCDKQGNPTDSALKKIMDRFFVDNRRRKQSPTLTIDRLSQQKELNTRFNNIYRELQTIISNNNNSKEN